MGNYRELWLAAFRDQDCRGYYEENPCHAQTCDPADKYCIKHAALFIEEHIWKALKDLLDGDNPIPDDADIRVDVQVKFPYRVDYIQVTYDINNALAIFQEEAHG